MEKKSEEKFVKNCEGCGTEMNYANSNSLAAGIRNNAKCKTCVQALRVKLGPFTRKCPQCGDMLSYNNKSNLARARKDNTTCMSCAIQGGKFTHICPDCKTEVIYTKKSSFNKAEKEKSICKDCAKAHKNAIISIPVYQCPDCKTKIQFKNKCSYNRAIRLGTKCKPCGTTKYHNETLLRQCPDCNKDMPYKTKAGFRRATKLNSICYSCNRRSQTPLVINICAGCNKELTYKNTGTYYDKDTQQCYCYKCTPVFTYVRSCPDCNDDIHYNNNGNLQRGIQINSKCDRCQQSTDEETKKCSIEARQYQTRYLTAKRGARRRGLIWTITMDDYYNLMQMPCYYCNNLLCPPVKEGSGLDRMNNLRGYELDNVATCCRQCNWTKGAVYSAEEMKAIAKLIIKIRNLSIRLAA